MAPDEPLPPVPITRREELQLLLETTLGSENVYFQPPPSLLMKYPAIVYSRNDIKTKFANNKPYGHDVSYSVTVIDRNPDSLIPMKVADLPQCDFSTQFASDGLNHVVFTLFY